MNDDDISMGSAAVQAPRGQGGVATLEDDMRSGGTPARPTTSRTSRAAAGELIQGEVAGDAPIAARTETAGVDQEVGPDGTEGEVLEASAEALRQESGEESATSDLRGLEGFEELSGTESTGTNAGSVLQEAGAAAQGEAPEFLPFLASLVPALVSSIGPAIAGGITSRLSPRAARVIRRMPVQAPGAPRPVPGGAGALLAQIAQLLRQLQTAPAPRAGESSMEAATSQLVEEAVAVLEVIIGADDRVLIGRTTEVPWRRICALRITFPTGAVYRGSGFLIGPRAVATAGHCVYLHAQGGWARKVEVIPGSNGTSRPHGSAESVQLRSVQGWVTSKLPESDYGCIVLPQNAFGGRSLGSFGFAALTPAQLVAQPAVLAGYPGDKPFAEMWGMARKVKTVGPKTLAYDIDTVGGQSGAPVYVKKDGTRLVVAIHNYGAASGNSATRITQPVYERLLAWSRL